MANVKSRPAGLQVKMARFQLQNPINPCSLPTACSHLLPGGVNSPGSHISSLRFVVFTAGGITADSWFCHKLIPHHYMSRSCLTWLFDFCQMIVYQTMTAICKKIPLLSERFLKLKWSHGDCVAGTKPGLFPFPPLPKQFSVISSETPATAAAVAAADCCLKYHQLTNGLMVLLSKIAPT